jgi:hypothetical protein
MLTVLSQHPADPWRSPYTGWTRAHWEAVADQLLLAVRPYASPGHALIGLPGPASRSGAWSDRLEGVRWAMHLYRYIRSWPLRPAVAGVTVARPASRIPVQAGGRDLVPRILSWWRLAVARWSTGPAWSVALTT